MTTPQMAGEQPLLRSRSTPMIRLAVHESGDGVQSVVPGRTLRSDAALGLSDHAWGGAILNACTETLAA